MTISLADHHHDGTSLALNEDHLYVDLMNTSIDLTALAWDFDAHGMSGRDDAVLRVARWARVAGVDPVLVDVFADASTPEPVRLRAFGRLAVQLSRLERERTPAAA